MSLAPFRLADVHFFVNSHRLRSFDTPLSELRWATFMSPNFNDQKNMVHEESIRHGLSGHKYACAVLRILSRAEYLHTQVTPPTYPYTDSMWASDITTSP